MALWGASWLGSACVSPRPGPVHCSMFPCSLHFILARCVFRSREFLHTYPQIQCAFIVQFPLPCVNALWFVRMGIPFSPLSGSPGGISQKQTTAIERSKKRKMIRKPRDSRGSSHRDGQGTWIYQGFSQCHSLEKESQNLEVRGFFVEGGAKKETKKKKHEVKEKNNPRGERSRHGRHRERTVGGERKTRGCGIKAEILGGLRHERGQTGIQNENRSSKEHRNSTNCLAGRRMDGRRALPTRYRSVSSATLTDISYHHKQPKPPGPHVGLPLLLGSKDLNQYHRRPESP